MVKLNVIVRLVLITTAMVSAGSATADKPNHAGKGKQDKGHQNEQRYDRDDRQQHDRNRSYPDQDSSNYTGGRFFFDLHRTIVRDYYVNEFRSGHCPPGLAKKQNGCLPPGRAKKWVIGRPLPQDVIFYDLPSAIVLNIGSPPRGYRFVRVASDILMIAVGTGLVMDAIQDFGGL
ncbi:MAG: hypothetical protein ACU843_14910 [Gammaproteobacteria bacterium]